MKRKITSHSDLLHTVAAVKWPGLSPADKHLLLCLALDAYGVDGSNAHPGKDALAERLGCSRKTVYNRMKRPLELGLVELTHEGIGKGNANVYRLRLEHDGYPDNYTNISEKASKGGNLEDETGNASYRLPIMQTGNSKRVNESPEPPKQVNEALKGGNSGYPLALPTLQQPPQPASPKTTGTAMAETRSGGCGDAENLAAIETTKPTAAENVTDVAAIVIGLYVKQENDEPKGSLKKPTTEMISLARTHGREKFLNSAKAWLKDRPWANYGQPTKFTFSTFLGANYPKYLAKADLLVDQAAKDAQKKIDYERAGRAATIVHGADEFRDYGTPDEQARYAELVARRFDATDDDMNFVFDFYKRAGGKRLSDIKAKHAEVADATADAIEKGNW